MTRCDRCKRVLWPGAWPWCGGDPAKHGEPQRIGAYTFILKGLFH